MKPAPADYVRKSLPNSMTLEEIYTKCKMHEPNVNLALRRAAMTGLSDEVECLLLDYEASPDEKSSNGFTALDWDLQEGKLSKETAQLLYHMQESDSAAKTLLHNARHFNITNKNELLAYALHTKDKANQTLLIETFKADLYAAREIFMNTSYNDDFQTQFMKKNLELNAQEMAEAAKEAILRGYRIAFCDFRENGLLDNDNSDPTNTLALLSVAASTAITKEQSALTAIAQKNVERRLAEENGLMGSMFKIFKPFGAEVAAQAAQQAERAQNIVAATALSAATKKLRDDADAQAFPSPM